MTTTTENRDSVEQLAEMLASDTRMANGPFKARKLAAMEILTDHFQKPTPPPTDAHRERVRVALAELSRRADGGNFSSFIPVIEATRVPRDMADLLIKEHAKLELSPECGWAFGHDAIARANGLPVLGEAEMAKVDKEWLTRMADAEDKCPSIAVGGLAHDLGMITEGPSPPPPQPEVTVSERDRLVEAAQKIEQLKCDGLYAGAFVNSVHAIIANAFAPERADSAKVRAEHERDKAAILELQEMVNAAEERANVRGCELTKVRAERESLRTQLAATEAKLREAEGRVASLQKGTQWCGKELHRVYGVVMSACEEIFRLRIELEKRHPAPSAADEEK